MSPDTVPALEVLRTEVWVRRTVIAHNFCPFAGREVDAGRVLYQVSEQTSEGECLLELQDLCERLLGEEAGSPAYMETAFLILPQGFETFFYYLDFLDRANASLQSAGFEGELQLASFHPEYCFAGESDSDPANYTNRSPYPMLHLIREASLEKALASFDDPEGIPERNIACARALGAEALASDLADCRGLHPTE